MENLAGHTGNYFVTTRWSLICRAGAEQISESDERRALEELCRTYWYPLYFYVRRRGYDSHQAQDLTQSFFEQLIERNSFTIADRERGLFRTFLLSALNNFLANERAYSLAKKRGGGAEVFSIDAATAEDRFQHEPYTEETAERAFEKRWIETLLTTVLDRLAAECAAVGQLDRFEALKIYLVEDRNAGSFVEMARQLKTTEASVKGVVRRLRSRYRQLIREEISHTVTNPEQVDSELRHLISIF
jgi:DNA-directed RNA polymerase specialized sigma24 family protein